MIFILKFARIIPLSDINNFNLEISEKYLSNIVQHFHFKELFSSLKQNKNVPSSFRRLSPFLECEKYEKVSL